MQVQMINRGEVLQQMLAHAIEGNLVNKRVVADQADNAIASLQSISCPAEELHIGIVELGS